MQSLHLTTVFCVICYVLTAIAVPHHVADSKNGRSWAGDSDKPPAMEQTSGQNGPKRPHIVMIVADDLGWNDVGWRDPTMHTPVLNRLASEGVVLNQSYVQPVCSPTRAAFLSGYYPYHLGLQHKSLRATQKAYLPANITTLPQHLQKLGYKTHMAGKWHLGFCNWRYTPTYRGFDSFVGFYNAIEDYYAHTGHRNGYDFRHNKDVYYSANGTYSAYIFTQHIEQVIDQHDINSPLFVYLPYQSVHGPQQVPKHYTDSYCSHIKDSKRRIHCGMVAALDEGVGNVTQALQRRGMLEDTLLLFTTDNGGPVPMGSNNWPLRGSKATLWEGGTRATAFLHAPGLLKRKGSYEGMIHAVDWLPTLVQVAGGQAIDQLDGVSQWNSIVEDKVPSARTEFVYNIDELKKNAALRQGRYKLLQGNPGKPDSWYPPPHLQEATQQQQQQQQKTVDTVSMRMKDTSLPQLVLDGAVLVKEAQMSGLRWQSGQTPAFYEHPLPQRLGSLQRGTERGEAVNMDMESDKNGYLLFDLQTDPNEHSDVKDKYPEVFKHMRARLEEYRKSLVKANFPPHDPASYPKNFNGTWSPGWC